MDRLDSLAQLGLSPQTQCIDGRSHYGSATNVDQATIDHATNCCIGWLSLFFTLMDLFEECDSAMMELRRAAWHGSNAPRRYQKAKAALKQAFPQVRLAQYKSEGAGEP